MIRALIYLRLTSLRNRIRTQLLRLRQPKYLLGAVFVIAYFWFFFFRHSAPAMSGAPGMGMMGMKPGDPLVTALLAIGLSIYLVQMWIVPRQSPGIKFTQPEIAFLFPAPITRRSLIYYKVVSVLITALGQACFFALIFNHSHLLRGEAVRTLFSWWAVLALISLHQIGSSLTIARLAARGLHSSRRRRIALVAGSAIAALLAYALWKHLPDAAGKSSGFEWLVAAFSTGPAYWLLLPARTMLAPALAPDMTTFVYAYLPVLVILAGHLLWVVRTEVAFEEASIATSEQHAARLETLRNTGSIELGRHTRSARRDPFNVVRTRWPELAFLWKNLLSAGRPWFTARVWLGSATVMILLNVALQRALGSSYWMAGAVLAALGFFIVVLTLLYGPLITRLDLRQDLRNADILRTYPLPGWRILLGELLAPVVILSAIVWLGLLTWYLGLYSRHPPTLSTEWFSPAMRLVLLGCAGVLTPFVVALQLLVPNGAVILFPAMFRTSRTPGQGVDLMGQRMLFSFGQFMALGAVFVPAVGLAVASYFGMRGLLVLLAAAGMATHTSPSPLTTELVGTAVMLAVLTAEIWCGIWWLGGRFEKIDLAVETQP